MKTLIDEIKNIMSEVKGPPKPLNVENIIKMTEDKANKDLLDINIQYYGKPVKAWEWWTDDDGNVYIDTRDAD